MAEFLFDTESISAEDARRLASALAPLVNADAPLTAELLSVDEAEIRRLNAQYRAVDAVTDVLSFPSMELERGKNISVDDHRDSFDGETLFLGSIVICEKRAREQAEEYAHSYEREFYYLTVHGVLHCLGYDHMNEEDKREMRLKEEEVMRRMNLTQE